MREVPDVGENGVLRFSSPVSPLAVCPLFLAYLLGIFKMNYK